VLPLPAAGFEAQPESISIFDSQVTIVDLSSKDVSGWRYAFGDGNLSYVATPTHFYRDIGKFVITQIVSNKFGCTDTAKQIIEVTPEFRFWIPNTFSPDGNGLNDVFKPSLFGVSEYDFLIMDRWGRKVFATNDPQEGWDGKLKGVECKQDVYAWRIVYRNTVSRKQEEKGGHVLLLRDP
jgi:gliding motility-associated-like protein